MDDLIGGSLGWIDKDKSIWLVWVFGLILGGCIDSKLSPFNCFWCNISHLSIDKETALLCFELKILIHHMGIGKGFPLLETSNHAYKHLNHQSWAEYINKASTHNSGVTEWTNVVTQQNTLNS